ncbi:MAG: T9SS type A sorting domain-containing protein [Saprospiraceae bacterium]|nr:T9SS type A sorting domain-containing protein [Saprospiraceae bacterium]
MKNLLLRSLILLSLFIGTTHKALAHFGSKGPFGGYVTCSMVYDSLVYLGTANGGVYRSTNSNLVAWSALPVGLKSGKISALAHTGSYLFAGTLDSGVYIFNGYVGTDRHWIKINTGLANLKVKSLLALDSITLLLGTEGGGLYKTTNKGATWTAISSASLNNASVTALVKVGSRIIASTLAGGVFVSNDNGSNWTSFNDANTLNIGGTISLAYNATSNELAVINKNGLYILTNASTTTTPVFNAAQTGLATGTVLRSIATNGTNWYLATDKGVYATPTGTINWTAANSGLKTTDVVVVVPFRTSLVVGTNKEGVFKTAASSIAWVENNTNYNNVVTYSMETSGVAVVVAATENGVFVSTDLAATYARANKGLTDSLNVNYLRFFGTVLYAGTKNGGVFVSADTGKTWTAANSGLTNLNIKKIFASNTNVYVLDANNVLFQLVGSTWTSIQTGLPTGTVPSSLAFYGTKLLLGTLGQGVFTRDVTSGSWTAANTGLTNLNVTSVAANASGKKIFAGTDGSGVFVSDATSLSWKQTSPVSIEHTTLMGLDGSKIQEMAYYAGYIFASYRGGLLATSDNGTTWIAGGNQFNLPSYTAVYRISFVTTRVFVTTENNALYSNALSELPTITDIDEVNNALSASISISPNPTKGDFNIQLKDLDATVNSITIFDNMGRLMQTMTQVKGMETITVSANYPTGLYFVRLNTDKGIAVKKVVIE